MKRKQLIAWITVGVMCLSAVLTTYPAKTAEAMTILETDVTAASAGCTMLGVYGSYYSQAQDALDRINEIRWEACKDGNVPDPRNESRMLTTADYVPIKWSTDLESVARIRAVEGGLSYGFFGSGHNRLNGKTIWTVSYNGITSSGEDLAYNFGTSMVAGIDQWYGEKAAWVSKSSTAVTGHYTSMINPKHTYVGLGDFYTNAAQYPNTLAGEFSTTSAALDQTMQTAPTDVMQKIEVADSYIKGYVLEGKTTIGLNQPETLTLRAEVVNGANNLKLWTVASMEYTSSNTSVATVTNEGVVTGHKSGETTITVKSAGNILTKATITVRCDHDKELLSSTDSTCTKEGLEVYYCDICDVRIEQIIPKLDHDYVYGAIDSEGYTTGICSMCEDSIRIIRPTTCKIYWRNSTSNDNYYYTSFPTSNPIGSVIYCWIQGMNGDGVSQEVIIKSSDESVISVPETVVLNDSSKNKLYVLAPGTAVITVYPKYNLSLKKTFTVRIEDTATPSPAPTSTVTPTQKPTSTASSVPTSTVTPTLVPTVTVTPTPTLVPGVTASPAPTLAPGVSASPTLAPGMSASPTLAPGVSASPTLAPGVSASPTSVPGVAASPAPTLAPGVSASPTSVPGVAASPAPTLAPGMSASPTLAPGMSASPAPTLAPGVSASPAPTLAPGVSASPTPDPTGTVIPSPTPNPTGTVTPSPTPDPTGTVTSSPTSDPTGTATPTPDPIGTATPTPDPTGTATPTPETPVTETPVPEDPGLGTSDPERSTFYINGAYQYKITGVSTVAMVGTKSSNITKIKVPKTIQINGKTYTVTAIADNAFKKNKKITSVTIGDNVKTIGASAFEGCTKVTKITLGKGVTKIGSSAFKNCKKLKNIVIKSTKLKKVGKNALKGIKPTAKIKVPAKKLSKYKKLLKNKGQGKKVKVVK